MATVLVVTKGTAGDLIPSLSAAIHLQGRRHEVVVFSHCDYRAVVEAAGVTFVALDSPEERAAFLADLHLLNSPAGSLTFFRRHDIDRVLREYDLLASHRRGRSTVFLSRHMATVADLLVAERYGDPIVRLFTAPMHVGTRNLLRELLRREMEPLRAIRTRIGLEPRIDLDRFLRLPVANIGCWPQWFDADPSWPADVVPVGFLTCDSCESGEVPEDVSDLLARPESPVLVYGSTADLLHGDFRAAALEACRLSGTPAVLVGSAAGVEHLTRSANVVHSRRLPFASVLPRFSAIVHHGGLSTIARSIASGVPQLVLPHGAERPYNGFLVRRLGLGVSLDRAGWNPRRVAESLSQVRSSNEIRRVCARHSAAMRAADAPAFTATVVENAADAAMTNCAS